MSHSHFLHSHFLHSRHLHSHDARSLFLLVALLGALLSSPATLAAPPSFLVDLAAVPPDDPDLWRVYGSRGQGFAGLPVVGGPDVDGDRFREVAIGFFTSDPLGRSNAGEVALVFGDGRFRGTDSVDTFVDPPQVLRILGAAATETAGNEVWLDDITGDGLGDVLICRQNFTPEPARPGAGALTVIVGSPELAAMAARGEVLDLANPPPGLTITTLVGVAATDRLGIWVRTGDVDADGIADVVVGADQEDGPGDPDRGAVWVVRGGPHWASGITLELFQFGASPWEGLIAKVIPPPGSDNFHLGATCQVFDLDGNGRAEVLAAAALSRSGASFSPAGAPGSARPAGGAPNGRLYIVWDDNFAEGAWPAGFTLDLAGLPGGRSEIRGQQENQVFGEEILGGLDYDNDGTADLFAGDLAALQGAGLGHLLFEAHLLRNRVIDLAVSDGGLRVTRFLGPVVGALGSDTAAHGDFDGDGIADLALTAPHAAPMGRVNAGVAHVFFGRQGPWPAEVRTASGQLPNPEELRVTEVWGALGRRAGDEGDTLGYSAAALDLDGDGRTELITNEMVGNGLGPGTLDVGNLLVLHGEGLWPGLPPLISRRLLAP